MSAPDFRRYARQVVLPEVGVDGQAMLRDATVLILGLGGLGSPAALYLAAAGVGRLRLLDRDRVELSNLQRQLLYSEADIGRKKVDAAIDRLRTLDAGLDVAAIEPAPFDAEPEAAQATLRTWLGDVDLVLDCSDNFPTRFALNAACVAARRPLVSGAAIRDQGQVLLIDPRRGSGCYACLYPEAGEAAERCEDAGVYGPLVGTIGSLQAQMALQCLLGRPPEAGVLHRFNARDWQWRQARIRRDPHCPHCGNPSSPQ